MLLNLSTPTIFVGTIGKGARGLLNSTERGASDIVWCFSFLKI